MILRVLRCIAGWGLAWLATAAPVLAQSLPPQEPILRIDPGMHTAKVGRIGADAACTVLATASHDKTVRLWQLPEGKLLRTLRWPIGAGDDGKVYATAVAPDGSWVAAAGWTAGQKELGGDFVYIFDRQTGSVRARLGLLADVINHLAVSADGRYLAATSSSRVGLRVWERTGADLAGWRLIGDDRDYGGESYGAAFDRTGVLYTVADDGKLRRYAPGYRDRPKSVVTRGGKRPFSIVVHPSDDRVAVGFEDSTAVEVYDAATLAWRFAADTRNATNGDLASIAWSADGQRLYAGGRFNSRQRSPILVWDRAGQGQPREIDGARDTVLHLFPCSDGIAVGAGDPAFGLLGPNGRRRVWLEGVQADPRGQRGDKSIAVAADGRRVRFGLEEWGASPVLFDLVAEQLTDAPASLADLGFADTTSLRVTDWVNDRNPKLAGRPITLEQFEEARSLAIAPDRQRFVLGADWSLRGFDRGGKQLWQKEVPGAVWSVNITRDGRLVLAGYSDGTVRWHRLSDGEELLALFVHKVDRRWVAWTPKGYYIASPGAEALIGWHVNRGWNEAAQFYAVDRFRDQFNRPDIVKLVLQTLDEGRAIAQANRQANFKPAVEDVRKIAPPIVTIESPGNGSTFRTSEMTIEYNVLSPTGGKITDVQVRINNASLVGARLSDPATFSKGRHRFLDLPPEDVTISIVAYEGDRASEPATIRLRWDGPRQGQVALPRLRALFIGINEYTKLRKLRFAAKDATDMAALFKTHEGRSYSKVDAKVLTDATRVDIIKGFSWLEKGSEEGDVNLLFLAGHGDTDEQQQFYFAAADTERDELRATAVSKDDILRTIRNLKGSRIVMLDTCRAGASADTSALAAPSSVDMNKAPNEIGDKSLGVLLYASAQGRQLSLEYPEWGNGAFTKAMLEGLGGAADGGKLGYIDSEELSLYVRRRVMALAKEKGLVQVPVRVKPDAAPEMKLVLLK